MYSREITMLFRKQWAWHSW